MTSTTSATEVVPSRRSRLTALVLGPPSVRRLSLTHAIDDFADAMVNLSLVGSLFFSVSFAASRSRILLYLVLTALPLALIAPVVGPLLDRLRAGYATVVIGSQVVRAAAALALASSLLSAAFYPLVFVVLLSRKAYALGKTAMVAHLTATPEDLVVASGHLARTGTVAGGAGTAVAGVVIATSGAEWLPVVGAVGFAAAALAAGRIPRTARSSVVDRAVVRGETPTEVRLATIAVAAIRAGAGALTYLLALAIKRGGGDEWIFAAALVGAGIGSFVGTMVSPWLHRRLVSDRVVVLALLGPGVVSAFGVLTIGSLAIIAIAFAIGLGSSVSARAMDGLYGRVPERVRGRSISRSELIFQLANVGGAAAAVWVAPQPRVGFAVVALVLLVVGFGYASRRRLSIRYDAARLLLGEMTVGGGTELPHTLLAEAMRFAEQGEHRVAIVVADSAVRVVHAQTHADAPAASPSSRARRGWVDIVPTVDAVVAGRVPATGDLAMAVIRAAGDVVVAEAPPA